MSEGLIKLVDESAGDQQVVNGDGLLVHRRCSFGVTEDAVTTGVVLSIHATGVDELKRLAVLQGTLHNEITSDRVILEAFDHLPREELQIESPVIRAKVSRTQIRKRSGVGRGLLSHYIGVRLISVTILPNV